MDKIIEIIGSTCLKHHDSGESSVNREARLIIEALKDNGYSIVKNNVELGGVSQQRELLLAFCDYLEKTTNIKPFVYKYKIINIFIAIVSNS